MHTTIGRKKNVVEASVDPGLMVFPAPVGIDVWCPRAGERVHSIFVLKQVGFHEAVFSDTSRHQTVIPSVSSSVAVA